MPAVRQFSIRGLFLLGGYVAVLSLLMKRIHPLYACAAIAFWLVPVCLAMFIANRVTLMIWCAALHVATYVILREVFFFTARHANASDIPGVALFAWSAYSSLADLLAVGRGVAPSQDDRLNSVMIEMLIVPLVGLVFSYCTFSPRDAKSPRATTSGE